MARDSSMSRTLNFFNSSCKRGSAVARICAARMPALRAPLMATVATGNAGRHLHHGQERINAVGGLAENRTSMTGRGGESGCHTGEMRGAPAPQMKARMPRAGRRKHILRGHAGRDGRR